MYIPKRSWMNLLIRTLESMDDEALDILDPIVERTETVDAKILRDISKVDKLRMNVLRKIIVIQKIWRGVRKYRKYRIIRRRLIRLLNRVMYSWKWFTWSSKFYTYVLKNRCFRSWVLFKKDLSGSKFVEPPREKHIIVKDNKINPSASTIAHCLI